MVEGVVETPMLPERDDYRTTTEGAQLRLQQSENAQIHLRGSLVRYRFRVRRQHRRNGGMPPSGWDNVGYDVWDENAHSS